VPRIEHLSLLPGLEILRSELLDVFFLKLIERFACHRVFDFRELVHGGSVFRLVLRRHDLAEKVGINFLAAEFLHPDVPHVFPGGREGEDAVFLVVLALVEDVERVLVARLWGFHALEIAEEGGITVTVFDLIEGGAPEAPSVYFGV